MFEIDFLAVGQNSKSGDAIAVRYTLSDGEQRVILVDGGTVESATALSHHIKTVYKTNYVDLAICSHLDADHARGFARVLQDTSLNFGEIWLHRPWLRRSLSDGHQVEDIAQVRGIPMFEPFSDGAGSHNFSEIVVLGPDQTLYDRFKNTVARVELAESGGLLKALRGEVEENWETEHLQDPPLRATSPANNASIVWLLRLPEGDFLFTADAGVEALENALQTAEVKGIDLRDCRFQQIPHHGSRNNIGPTILNRLLGSTYDANGASRKLAFASAAANSHDHPSRQVLNAYTRRGWQVQTTQGFPLLYSSPDVVQRPNYQSVSPLPLFPKVENT